MTAPTSPGVVPADDVRELVERLRRKAAPIVGPLGTRYRENDGILLEAADMLERLANRPSLTEDEQEPDPTVGERMREAIIAPYRNDLKGMDDAEIVGAINHARGIIDEEEPWLEALVAEQERRALADRSEPRQEKEGDRA